MGKIVRLIGGAGTGKTTELLRWLEIAANRWNLGPREIGFVSFTRAARREAAERAAGIFGTSPDELSQWGYFRTLHSICYQAAEIRKGSLILGTADDQAWLSDATDGELGGMKRISDDDDQLLSTEIFAEETTPAEETMAAWNLARASLASLADVLGDKPTSRQRELIERYERRKRLDGRLDFVDLLGLFAGVRFRLEGAERVEPVGLVPAVPVWFFDEQQDTSPLLDLVCRRIVREADPELVVVAGDPFQAIYGFAGSRSALFLAWSVDEQRIMPKTWRNPPAIHELGESLVRYTRDYFDRKIQPADHPGEILVRERASDSIPLVDPRESWLVITRTNYQAAQLGGFLNRHEIPWHPTKGNGGWKAPKQVAAALALWSLHHDRPITADEWRTLVDVIPATNHLRRGAKLDWKSPERRPAKSLKELAKIGHGLDAWGALPELEAKIRSDEAYRLLGERGAKLWKAFGKFGELAVIEPKVQVGTIHSVKGAEADHVLLLAASTKRAMSGDLDEERRLAYVAVTRARRRLVIARTISRRDVYRLPGVG